MPNQDVSGTLDFKWPQGKTIVVAFQSLPAADEAGPPLEALVERFRAVAELWLREMNLKFAYLQQALPAPAIREDGGVFAASDLTSYKTGASPFVEYDLLISFASMPLWFQDRSAEDPSVAPATPPEPRELTGQASILGSYALRADYGTPTMLLGPNRVQLDATAGFGTREKYFASAEFGHIAMHEIGHALGLAHEHQSPEYNSVMKPELVPRDQIIVELNKLSSRFATQFDQTEVQQELTRVWPRTDLRWSEWRDWSRVNPSERPENVSVMAHPGWSNFLTRTFDGKSKIHSDALPESDADHARELYPRH